MSYVCCWRGFMAHLKTNYKITCKFVNTCQLASVYKHELRPQFLKQCLPNLHIVQMRELIFLEHLLSTNPPEHNGLPGTTVGSNYFANHEISGASLLGLVKEYRVHLHWPKGLHKVHEKHTITKLALCNWPVFTDMNCGHSFSSSVYQTNSVLGIQFYHGFLMQPTYTCILERKHWVFHYRCYTRKRHDISCIYSLPLFHCSQTKTLTHSVASICLTRNNWEQVIRNGMATHSLLQSLRAITQFHAITPSTLNSVEPQQEQDSESLSRFSSLRISLCPLKWQ